MWSRETQFNSVTEVYTQTEIPVSRNHIPTQKVLSKWPYLNEVHLTQIDAGKGLLIGMNAPKLMELWEVLNSQGSGPYAIKTLLGWVVNGLLHED